jgi:hypothetical protein
MSCTLERHLKPSTACDILICIYVLVCPSARAQNLTCAGPGNQCLPPQVTNFSASLSSAYLQVPDATNSSNPSRRVVCIGVRTSLLQTSTSSVYLPGYLALNDSASGCWTSSPSHLLAASKNFTVKKKNQNRVNET